MLKLGTLGKRRHSHLPNIQKRSLQKRSLQKRSLHRAEAADFALMLHVKPSSEAQPSVYVRMMYIEQLVWCILIESFCCMGCTFCFGAAG